MQALSHEAAHQVKQLGLKNERVRQDTYFDPIKDDFEILWDPATFIGCAPEQVDSFLREWVGPALADAEFQDVLANAERVELNV